ncbi:hypothetical protein BD560DRAFT_472772, partial [Blakeslea trispora]
WCLRLLLKAYHNESWFRTHVYSAVSDNAFMYNDKFISKRTDCYSNIIKESGDVDNQRVDFVLRNINDNLSTEESPSLRGVKGDMKINKALQHHFGRKKSQIESDLVQEGRNKSHKETY